MQHQVLIFPCVCAWCVFLCAFAGLSVCLSASLFACQCVPMYRTSQQEQPKCAPLMSSCGRPPAKSQRLALLSTPPPSSPMSPFLLPLLLSPLTPPPSLHSLPHSLSVHLSFFIIRPCLLIFVLSLLFISIHHPYLGLVLKVTLWLMERRRGT